MKIYFYYFVIVLKRGPPVLLKLKSHARKVQVIMQRYRPNLTPGAEKATNFQGLVFIPKTDKLLIWNLKWKGTT